MKVRTFGEPKEYDLSGSNDLPAELEKLIVTVRDRYSYLFAYVDFDGDGEYNVWEINQDKELKEITKD